MSIEQQSETKLLSENSILFRSKEELTSYLAAIRNNRWINFIEQNANFPPPPEEYPTVLVLSFTRAAYWPFDTWIELRTQELDMAKELLREYKDKQ